MTRDELIKEAEHALWTPGKVKAWGAATMADFALEHEKRVRAEIAADIRKIGQSDAGTCYADYSKAVDEYIAKLESPDTPAEICECGHEWGKHSSAPPHRCISPGMSDGCQAFSASAGTDSTGGGSGSE